MNRLAVVAFFFILFVVIITLFIISALEYYKLKMEPTRSTTTSGDCELGYEPYPVSQEGWVHWSLFYELP